MQGRFRHCYILDIFTRICLECTYFPLVLQLSLNQTMAYFSLTACWNCLPWQQNPPIPSHAKSIFMYHYICHSYVTAWPESCITGRKQSVLLGVCKGKLWKVSGEEKDFISASYFKNSRKPPRCQPIPPCFYEEQDKHLQSRVILFLVVSKSPGPLQGCCWYHEHNMRLH